MLQQQQTDSQGAETQASVGELIVPTNYYIADRTGTNPHHKKKKHSSSSCSISAYQKLCAVNT